MTAPKFMIDECLSPELVDIAIERGYQAAHVAHIGKGGWQDWNLMKPLLDQDWTMVTNNAGDYRSEFGNVDLHAGLICLNGSVSAQLDLNLQRQAFAIALDEVEALDGDIVNKDIEVSLHGFVDEAPVFEVAVFPLPQQIQDAMPDSNAQGEGEGAAKPASPTKH
jgi:hypothetical protein